MDTSTDQQGLVRSVKIKLGSRNPQKKGNDTNYHHRKTSAKGGLLVGRRGLRQVPVTMLDVKSKIIHDCYVPYES